MSTRQLSKPAVPRNRDERRHPDPDPLRTVPQSAEQLATSERHIRRLVAERRIRFVKVGGLVRIPQSAIDQLRQDGTVEAVR